MSPLFTLRDVTTESPSFIQCLSWWRYCWWEPRTKPYAWFVMLRWNAIVILQICGSIWYHALGAMISAMNEWQMAWRTVFFTTHILKRGRRSRCVHLLPSHNMMILTHKILRIQHPQIILHLHCGEHPDQLHHRLVWKQHRWQPQSSAKSCVNCPPHCWRWASLPPGHLHQAVYKESTEDHQWLQPPVPQTVLSAALRKTSPQHPIPH